MKNNLRTHGRWLAAAVIGCLLIGGVVRAFPPAPQHTLFGMVRDQFGNPLNIVAPATVFLETPPALSSVVV